MKSGVEFIKAQLDGGARLWDGAVLKIYDGVRPGSPAVPVGAQNVLASVKFSSPAFINATSGTITANPITSDPSAQSSGIASWYRVFASDGTVLADGKVGTKEGDLILKSVSIVKHQSVTVSKYTITLQEGSP